MKVSVVIPAYNEENTITGVLKKIPKNYEKIVVDDNSNDNTAKLSSKYARVICNKKNLGYEKSIKKGIEEAKGDVIITMDSDGEHDPGDIKRFLSQMEKYDMVIGERDELPRLTEKMMAWLVRRRVSGIRDPANGFRAFKRELVRELSFENTSFGCKTLLRANKKGFKIKTLKIKTRKRKDEPRNKLLPIIKSILGLTKEIILGE